MKIYPLSLILILSLELAPRCDAHHDDGLATSPHAHKVAGKSAKNGDPFHLLDFIMSPAYALSTNVRTYVDGAYRIIDSNGIPNHATGQFPNRDNPNTISEQSYRFRMALDPKFSGQLQALNMEPFGVAVNGIPFDPAANEFWNRDRNSGWQYEPMFNHILGLDQNNAHVQPNGAYHYHGLPTGLLEKLAQSPKPVLIGYAADGFPIYAPFGYRDPKNVRSGMTKLRSSFKLKAGNRPSGPGGRYDGTFVQDYEYVAGAGELDECNGRFGVTSEYPKGIYHYVITDAFPFIPRQWRGAPDQTFLHHGHSGPPRGGVGGGTRGGGPGGGPGGPGVGPGGPGGYGPGVGSGVGVSGGPRRGPGGGSRGGPDFDPRGGPGRQSGGATGDGRTPRGPHDMP